MAETGMDAGEKLKGKTEFICPVCRLPMEDAPLNYNICGSCGTEFGLDDTFASIEELRDAWIKRGRVPHWQARNAS